MDATQTTFQKYPAYKDSGVEWLGEIPEHWETSRLRNVFSFSKGLTITKENLQEKGIYCVNYGEIHSKFGFEVNPEIHELKCVSEEYLLSDSNSLLKKGDFVFADTSEDIEGSGNFTYLNSDLRTFAGYHTIIARLKISVNERFAAYVIASQSFRNQIRNRVKGVKVFSISQSLLKTVYFWFPNTEEQTAIAAFLDDKTAKIDRAIAQKEKMIALLKERKQIIIQHAVTKGLDPKAKMKDSGVEWIGEVPEGWEVIPIRRIVEVRDGTHDTPIYIEESQGSHYLVTSKDFKGDEIDFSNAKSISKKDFNEIAKRSGVDSGDVIMSMIGGNIGKSVIANSKTDYAIKNVGLFKTYGNLSLSRFIRFYLQSGLLNIQVELNSRGGAQGFLSLGDLRNLKFFKIPTKDQSAIVHHIETQSAKIDRAITLQEQQIGKLKELKATLIDGAVTGKIKVS